MAQKRSAPVKSRIISWRTIREFIEAHPEDRSAPDAFAKWYDLVRNNRFANFNEVRRTFPSADLVTRAREAHEQGRPYSHATRGSVAVELDVVGG